MARVIPNPAAGSISGKIGNLVFVHRADGSVLVRKAPQPRSAFTAGELQSQHRFADAVAYIKRIKATPDVYGSYQHLAQETHQRACDLAMADFLNAPEIRDVDTSGFMGQPGNKLLIHASDHTGVQEVRVLITDLNGLPLEEGPAFLDDAPGRWVYSIQGRIVSEQFALIQITATDLAGNSVSRTVTAVLPKL